VTWWNASWVAQEQQQLANDREDDDVTDAEGQRGGGAESRIPEHPPIEDRHSSS
jgi:hypothetical protein